MKTSASPVQQQVARERGARRVGCGRRGAGDVGHAARRLRQAGRRTALRPTRRGTCCARGARRAPRASSRPGAAAPGRRDRRPGRTRARPGADPRARARARRAARPARSPGGRGRRRTPPRPALACAAASARSARRAGSPVSATARCRNAAAAAEPPRACARPADSSSSRATSSSGPCGRGGQVPRTAVRVDLPVRRLRQREVGGPPVLRLRRPVDGGARQRMAEGHAVLQHQQAVRRVDRGELDPEALAGALQEQRIADRLGRRDEQQTTCVAREGLEPPDVARLDPVRQVAGLRHAEAAGQLRRRQAPRQLEQRERVPACLREIRSRTVTSSGEAHGRAQQRAGVAVDEAAHLELRQVPKLLARLTRGEHEPDRLGQQTARDERERERRGLIQPLRVVHDAQQRALLGRVGEQAEHGEADQEAIRRGPRSGRRRSGARRAAEPGSRSSRSSSGAQS